ncbi:MAG: CAP domain-containing protein [Xenococcus sp. (in: cyanobacteria)]
MNWNFSNLFANQNPFGDLFNFNNQLPQTTPGNSGNNGGTNGGGTNGGGNNGGGNNGGGTNPGFINQVVSLVNHERNQAGLDSLQIDSQLAQAAQVHSENMADYDFFSHTGADGSSPFDRIRAAGYNYSYAGENIAAGQSTPEAVVQAWMGSSGHRANILNSNFTEIGIGYEFEPNDTGSVNYYHYWTNTFGAPL